MSKNRPDKLSDRTLLTLGMILDKLAEITQSGINSTNLGMGDSPSPYASDWPEEKSVRISSDKIAKESI